MHAYFPKDYASIHAEYFELSRSYYIQYAHATPCPVTNTVYCNWSGGYMVDNTIYGNDTSVTILQCSAKYSKSLLK